jgi:hypothetical protein
MGFWRIALVCVAVLCSLRSSVGLAERTSQPQQILDRLYRSLPQTDLSTDRLAPMVV